MVVEMDYIVKDSSLWQDEQSSAKLNNRDNTIRAGIVRQEFFDEREGELETKYIVDVIEPGGQYPVICRRMVNYGGPFNYEEYTRQTYNEKTDGTGKGDFRTRPGDHVLIAYIGGDDEEGVIIGSLKHPVRKETLPAENKVAYASEFNGIETTITNTGEWQVRFRGQPTNISVLSQPPNEDDVAKPEYDTKVGNSFIKVDSTGSWTISDASTDKVQFLKIDKSGGTISIISGDIILTLDKNSESFKLINKKTTFNSTDEFNVFTDKFKVEAKKVEVTAKDIKTTGKIKHTGEVDSTGPYKIIGETKIIGNVVTEGTVDLGGEGGSPAVQQILLTFGIGNLGLPVISVSTVLTSQLTKMK